MSKHTPGRGLITTDVDGRCYVWDDSGVPSICDVHSGVEPDPSGRANAHLIVDALLQALKAAEAALADIGDADREPGDDLAWCEDRAAQALPQVRAAIAKAKGERQ